MELLRTHIEHGQNGDRTVCDLYENTEGFIVHINIEINEVHVTFITHQDNELKLWEAIVK